MKQMFFLIPRCLLTKSFSIECITNEFSLSGFTVLLSKGIILFNFEKQRSGSDVVKAIVMSILCQFLNLKKNTM